ncbi:MAG: acetylornithine/succinylornithine family transaminase, partial [Eubacteriales bacterium]
MNREIWKQKDKQYVANTYNRFDLVLEKGSGATCWDMDGKQLIDFTAGIGVNSLGFCNDAWVKAVSEQAAKLQHVSNLYYTEPCVALAETLCKRTGMAKAFFGNSGAEANEGAIKVARKYSFDKYGKGRDHIVALENSFHGRTMAALSATGQDVYHNFFFPFVDGFDFVTAGNFSRIQDATTENTCAVMMELVQGEGGVIALDKNYVQMVAEFCREKDLLLIIDEVQTGIGRTGSLFAYEQYEINPDIVTFAKGIGGGLPIGGMLLSEKAEAVLGFGHHGTTFGGNPVACAGANAVLKAINGTFLKNVQKKAEFAREKIVNMPNVQSVSGMGLMIGIEVAGKSAGDVAVA